MGHHSTPAVNNCIEAAGMEGVALVMVPCMYKETLWGKPPPAWLGAMRLGIYVQMACSKHVDFD